MRFNKKLLLLLLSLIILTLIAFNQPNDGDIVWVDGVGYCMVVNDSLVKDGGE